MREVIRLLVIGLVIGFALTTLAGLLGSPRPLVVQVTPPAQPVLFKETQRELSCEMKLARLELDVYAEERLENSLYHDLTDEQFVRLGYQVMFREDPKPDGLRNWMNWLRACDKVPAGEQGPCGATRGWVVWHWFGDVRPGGAAR